MIALNFLLLFIPLLFVCTLTATQEETSALGSSLIQLVDAVALSLLLLPGESVTIDLGNISEFIYLKQ